MFSTLNGLDNTGMLKSQATINNIKNRTTKSEKNSTFAKMLENSTPSNQRTGRIDAKTLNKEDKKLHDTCVELESLLWKQVLNEMKKTINKNSLLDGGQAEEIFTDFLYDEYAMQLSKHSDTGISSTMFKQLKGER